jgi:hypothetical protein
VVIGDLRNGGASVAIRTRRRSAGIAGNVFRFFEMFAVRSACVAAWAKLQYWRSQGVAGGSGKSKVMDLPLPNRKSKK